MQCPKCYQIDSVQKVSAVASKGISQGHAVGNNGENYALLSQSLLSSQLTPPVKDFKLLNEVQRTGLFFLSGGLLFGPIITSVYFYMLIFHQITLDFGNIFKLIGLISFLGLLIMLVALLLKNIIQWRNYPRRKRVATLWGKLYYCHRDDIIFLPGSSQYFQASEMRYILDKA